MMTKRNIQFDPTAHRYTDEDGNPYTSVTTLIGKYTPEFNKDYWSKYKAKQLGMSQRQVLNNWQEITDEACERGTREHKLIEDSVNDSLYYKERQKLLTTALVPLTGTEFTNVNLDILAQSELAKKYPTIFLYLRKAILDGWKLYVEKRVYSFEDLVAGTIDCLLVKGKQFFIVDWKTNKKEMHFKAGYYKKVGGIESSQWVDTNDRMLYPLGNLHHCKGTIYTLQLSLYAHILEMWGLVCMGLVLYHIRPEMEPKAYNMPFDKISAQLLLDDHRSRLTKTTSTRNLNKPPSMFGIT